MIRRPVCVLGFLFAVILFLVVKLLPQPDAGITGAEEQWIQLTGRVIQKEHKITSEQSVLLLYLDSVILESDISNHNNIKTNPSKSNSNKLNALHSNKTQNKNQIKGILCYLEEGEEPKMGAAVRILGKLRAFREATNPGAFDSRQYYRILKLDASLQKAKIIATGKEYNWFLEGLYQIKQIFSKTLDHCFNKKDASVMKAMLLGDKSELDQELKKLYQDNGIIHILAISGLHISLIGMGFYKLLLKIRIPSPVGIIFSVALIWCYGLMAAMGASAIRAIVMFSLRLLAKQLGRTYDMLTGISVAGVLLLLEQPLYFNHNGFLFSFGAVLSLAILSPVFRAKRLPSAPLAVTVGTLPVHLYYYFQFPLYSVLINLIVIPLMTIVMGGGLFCMTLGSLALWSGRAVGAGVSLILSFYEWLCRTAEVLPGNLWVTGRPGAAAIFLYFILLAGICFRHRKLPTLIFANLLMTAVMILTLRLDGGLMITVLDVGQGDGTHISMENRLNILIDCGSSSEKELGKYQLLPALKEAGTDKLDAVFLTHPDQDHTSGFEELIAVKNGKKSLVHKLVLPDIAVQSREEAFLKLDKTARENGIPVLYMSNGQFLEMGDLKITALHPPKGFVSSEPNEYSLVLLLEYGDFRGLLTGDIEGIGEQMLLENQKLLSGQPLTFLKVAHHGSNGSTSRKFLELVRPYSSVISCAKKNRYGHPGKELMERLQAFGSRTYLTLQDGAVRLVTDGKELRIRTFLGDSRWN